MRKVTLFFAIAIAAFMTSCYTQTYSVGSGAQSGTTVTQKNHYVIGGLVPLKVSDPQQMAGGAQNFTVKTQQSFVDGFLRVITSGIYTPTTTTVTK
ncbi:MAG: Bor family protein [Bacteroidales bacterium]|jgi:ABC-type oligopeptide transport system substrate-binding subunit|nr:Bor family protein [Bacteroidales bacterium]